MPVLHRVQPILFRGRHKSMRAPVMLSFKVLVVGLLAICAILIYRMGVSDSSFHTASHVVRNEDAVLLFHLVFTTDVDKFTTLNLRTIESIFFHHPKASVRIHWSAKFFRLGETPPPEPLQKIQERGYDLRITPYDVEQILKETLRYTDDTIVNKKQAEDWMSQIQTRWVKEKFWTNNESNIVRVCLLLLHGGIYIDTDAVVTQSFDTSSFPDNSMAVNEKDELAANFVMKFLHPGNKFLQANMADFFANYNGNIFGHNGVKSLGRTINANPTMVCPNLPEGMKWPEKRQSPNSKEPCWFNPLPRRMFTAVPYYAWDFVCFGTDDDELASSDSMNNLRQNPMATLKDPSVYVIHLNNYITQKKFAEQPYVKDSLCDLAFQHFRILR